eukprot:gene19729-biopygen1267
MCETTLCDDRKEKFRSCLEPDQHAVGMTAAIEKLAKSVQCLVDAVDGLAAGILDAVSAYNNILREPILEEVSEDCTEILTFLATFLCRTGKYVFYDDDGQAHVIASADGVDQGGPLSPPAFAFGLRRALRRIRARLQAMLDAAREAGDETLAGSVVRLLSYLDDLTILVPSPLVGAAMGIADEELQAVGLYLNHRKTFVWAKSGRCPRGCQRWWRDTDGFVIVGAPYGRLVGPVDAGTEAEEGADVVDHDIVEAPV